MKQISIIYAIILVLFLQFSHQYLESQKQEINNLLDQADTKFENTLQKYQKFKKQFDDQKIVIFPKQESKKGMQQNLQVQIDSLKDNLLNKIPENHDIDMKIVDLKDLSEKQFKGIQPGQTYSFAQNGKEQQIAIIFEKHNNITNDNDTFQQIKDHLQQIISQQQQENDDDDDQNEEQENEVDDDQIWFKFDGEFFPSFFAHENHKKCKCMKLPFDGEFLSRYNKLNTQQKALLEDTFGVSEQFLDAYRQASDGEERLRLLEDFENLQFNSEFFESYDKLTEKQKKKFWKNFNLYQPTYWKNYFDNLGKTLKFQEEQRQKIAQHFMELYAPKKDNKNSKQQQQKLAYQPQTKTLALFDETLFDQVDNLGQTQAEDVRDLFGLDGELLVEIVDSESDGETVITNYLIKIFRNGTLSQKHLTAKQRNKLFKDFTKKQQTFWHNFSSQLDNEYVHWKLFIKAQKASLKPNLRVQKPVSQLFALDENFLDEFDQLKDSTQDAMSLIMDFDKKDVQRLLQKRALKNQVATDGEILQLDTINVRAGVQDAVDDKYLWSGFVKNKKNYWKTVLKDVDEHNKFWANKGKGIVEDTKKGVQKQKEEDLKKQQEQKQQQEQQKQQQNQQFDWQQFAKDYEKYYIQYLPKSNQNKTTTQEQEQPQQQQQASLISLFNGDDGEGNDGELSLFERYQKLDKDSKNIIDTFLGKVHPGPAGDGEQDYVENEKKQRKFFNKDMKLFFNDEFFANYNKLSKDGQAVFWQKFGENQAKYWTNFYKSHGKSQKNEKKIKRISKEEAQNLIEQAKNGGAATSFVSVSQQEDGDYSVAFTVRSSVVREHYNSVVSSIMLGAFIVVLLVFGLFMCLYNRRQYKLDEYQEQQQYARYQQMSSKKNMLDYEHQ